MASSDSPDSVASFWPTANQQLLLRAALLEPETAREAWRQWRARHDVDHLDHASFWLLPIVYRRLLDLAVEEPQLAILKGLYKRTWFRNQLLHRDYFETLALLERNGLATMAIKGVAALPLYGDDAGVRPMWDADFMVATADVPAALDVLAREGWVAKPACSYEHLKTSIVGRHHGWNFRRKEADIDMHWHLLPQDLSPFFDRVVWQHRQRANIAGNSVWVPSATEQLLQTCVHAARYNVEPSANWAADAFLLLRDRGLKIDWARLVDVTTERRFILPMRDSLRFLQTAFGLPALSPVIAQLEGVAVSDAERLEHEANTMHPLQHSELHHRAQQHLRRLRLSTLSEATELAPRPSNRQLRPQSRTSRRPMVARLPLSSKLPRCVAGWREKL